MPIPSRTALEITGGVEHDMECINTIIPIPPCKVIGKVGGLNHDLRSEDRIY
jgi:hypothetical protein